VGDIQIIGTPNQWMSTAVCNPAVAATACTPASVYAIPVSSTGQFHFGDLPRNALRGPTFYNTDLSLLKNTKIGGVNAQFRVEAFNVFNHPNLGQPGRVAAVGSTSFGLITGTRLPTGDAGSARQIQFAIKLSF